MKQRIITLIALLGIITTAAWAESMFTVTNTSGTSKFVITRTTNTSTTETVYYRTVSLSAIAGQHFTDKYGSLDFDAEHNSREVEVTESTPSSDVYKYQTAASRKYRFEVVDPGGFYLASCTRDISSGLTQFNDTYVNKSVTNLVKFNSSGNFTSDLSSSKYLDVNYTPPTSQVETSGTLQGYVLIDDSYDYAQKPATVSTNSLITSTGVTSTYLQNTLKYKIYATVCFTEKERDDGYQYIQIIAGNSAASYDGADGNGVIDNGPTNSIYKACFELSTGSDEGQGKAFFPHRYSTATGTNEFSLSDGNLWQQKFKSTSYQAGTSGSIILDPTVSNITTRFDAAGNNDDTWGYKDFFVRMALVDATAPTASGTKKANSGRHSKGNTFYISVPFDEIVVVTGKSTLSTSWGNLIYIDGSGSNVLTFSGTISDTASGSLTINSYSGTITDLAGNNLSGGISGNVSSTALEGDYAYPITYDLNGGTANNPTSYTYETATFTLNNPTRTGYTFDGWTDSNGTTASTSVQIEKYSHGNKSYTANWTPITYNITYDLAGGSVATANPETYTIESSAITLVNPTRTGYTFDGWTGSNGTTPETTVTIPTGSTEDKSYTANWTVHTYTVHFDANGGSGSMSDMSFTYDEAQNLTTNTFTAATGYVFNGWNSQANGTGTSYTDGQSVSNLTPDDGATVTLYAQWTDVWGMAGGADGTEQHPYTITTPAGLDLLATDVNNGNSYNGKHFVLDDNITYSHGNSDTENNYTAIGSYTNKFAGIFDGQNKTISGIRIYKENDDYQGLFGCIKTYTTIKNVILTDAVITGRQNVGGIVGYVMNHSTLDNCTVTNSVTINTVVNQSFYHGGIAGLCNVYSTLTKCTSSARLTITSGGGNTYGGLVGTAIDASINNNLVIGAVLPQVSGVSAIIASDHNSTLSANYYRNVTIGTNTESNIFTLSLPDGVTATGESVTYNNVTYYASNSTVTLSYTGSAILLEGIKVNGSSDGVTNNGNGTFTFTMPAEDVTITRQLIPVSYIDAAGDEQTCTDYTVIESSTDDVYLGNSANDEAWYVVPAGEVTISEDLYILDKAVHLILCDGAELNVSCITCDSGSLTIYGQTQQSGKLTATAPDTNALYVQDGDLTVNGGNIIATSANNTGIFVCGAHLIINRGNVTATSNADHNGISVNRTGKYIDGNLVYVGGNFTINGGNVSASGSYYGISASCTITLGWTNPEDRIYASSYRAYDGISVKSGQVLTDDTNTYTGTINAADIAGKTLQPFDPLIATVNDGSTTTSYNIDGTNTTVQAALQAAIEAATNASGSTVTLLQDVTLATDSYIECEGSNYTLDLNSHSITGNNSDCVLELYGITITGGSITNTGSGKAITIYNNTNISGCTITGNTAISVSDCNLTATNCTIIGTSYGIMLTDDTTCNFTLNGCTITGNVGIAFNTFDNKNIQSFIGNNTIKGCAFAGILINDNVKFKGLPHFGTGSDANGCDIVSVFGNSNGTIDFQSTSQAGYYDVPATPITVKAVEWDGSAYVDREVYSGGDSYTFATHCDYIEYPNTDTTIPIEEVFVSLNSDYIVRTSLNTSGKPTQLTRPTVFEDNANNNATTIETYDGEDCAVTLQGRTLYKDGYWNTLCVPFDANQISKTPLADAEIRKLESASLENGTLTLNFSDPVTKLVAGTPYIIKWTKPDGYVDDDAHNLVNPFFPSVVVSNENHDFTSTDGTVQFKGTYAPMSFNDTNTSILFMGAENTLYYPKSGASIGACRAYFQINDPSAQVKAFVLNFGDDETTDSLTPNPSPVREGSAGAWYTINGRRLNGKPTQRGIYIHNGRKVVIK